MLLAAGAEKNCTYKGSTLIAIASFKGHYRVVEVLLAAGADADVCDNDGMTPLWMAAYSGHHQVVELLLAAGASSHALNKYSATPMFIASFNGHHRVVEVLLAAGADKNAPMNDGRTPISAAFQNGHLRVLEVLLAAGAHLALWNCQISPQMAQQESYTQMIILLSAPLPQSIISTFFSRQSQLIAQLARLRKRYRSKQPQPSSATQLLSFKVIPYTK